MSKLRDEVKTDGKAVFYTVMWQSFREAAMDLGWTLALHGSMVSDMDIIAVRWVEDCASEAELIASLSKCIGATIWSENHFKPPIQKPHGRWCYTLSIYSDFYIDLCVIRNN